MEEKADHWRSTVDQLQEELLQVKSEKRQLEAILISEGFELPY